MKLNELSPADGSTKKRMRVGRGVGSGKGKTAGRGVKGQNARSGVAVNGFEGGQMPIYMRLPKRGFTSPGSKKMSWVNLGRIAKAIEAGQLDAANVTEESLVASGVVRNARDGIRLLAKGDAAYDIVHANAEFFDQVSDHDPTLLTLGAIPAPIPEPGTWLLAACGLGGLLARRPRLTLS